MATKAEIRQRVAEELSLVPVGQSGVEDQHKTRIDETYDEVYERLKEESLATWASTAEVPTKVAKYYRLMMLEELTRTYRVSVDLYNRIKLEAGEDGEKAMEKIARYVHPEYEPTGEPQDF